MGLSAVAGHLVIFMATVGAGTVFAGVAADLMSDTIEEEVAATHRDRTTRNEAFALETSGYASAADRVYANWTNNGDHEEALDRLHVLVGGSFIATSDSDVERFEVTGATTSNLWMPGETLELRIVDRGDVDVTLIGPHGASAFRRA